MGVVPNEFHFGDAEPLGFENGRPHSVGEETLEKLQTSVVLKHSAGLFTCQLLLGAAECGRASDSGF